MAEEEVKTTEKSEKAPKKGFNLKIIIIGLPLFIVQLVLVYFITATFLVKSAPASNVGENGEKVEKTDENSEEHNAEGENSAPQSIYNIDDLIINPAGTNGQQLLLLSVGFGVSNEEKVAELKSKEIIIKDLILNTVSQKSLTSLSKVELKDSLKIEIAKKINSAIPDANINNVYFSKYVLN